MTGGAMPTIALRSTRVATASPTTEYQIDQPDSRSEKRATRGIDHVLTERRGQMYEAKHAEQREARHGKAENRTRVLHGQQH